MLVFGKWSTNDVFCKDVGISKYVSFKERELPSSFGISKSTLVEKAKVDVVERLTNKLMRSGQGKKKLSGKFIRGKNACGKKDLMFKTVDEAFDQVYKITKENPVQVLIKAIEFSAPREDIVKLQRGGINYNQAVDVAPIKRLDEALKNLALAVFKATFKSRKDMASALAEELIAASKNDQKSYAVKRRDEIERIAQGSR
ncbi:MAG: 30S ribosomal protein S7 [archaeon]|jgi:small subunit ribosomal protein S7|nr:30S ribosomal protein S7 [archaeon]MDD2477651.1 30S ribosomal protein S7 [Candidatus ainarchaeum sp.]MDD3084377.1 30S ribosomal protein S7 [Candidatus ainarchaeum sp.]MDD4220833.1 30S ribosomal protein S7 [Candidatus ainarchaeum sp.]MDD4662333.1 30S ribosomal protein S7 [Candidatus ainarchaeum sp.]